MLIATGSIEYIASVSLISLAVCYMIGCLAFMGLRRRYPDMKRPYIAPYGVWGCYITIMLYCFMLIYADKAALITAGIITILCIMFWYFYTEFHKKDEAPIDTEIGEIEEPTPAEKAKMDRDYAIWKWGTIVVTVIALGIYLIPMFYSLMK